ncbi:MAG: tetratricopeptide repeat protein [Chloroflexi bacterium]|nr:tetratricopeptide repeat protein [Chloroflexota bacterium]
MGIAASLNNLGLVAVDQGDYAAAQALFEESLTHGARWG